MNIRRHLFLCLTTLALLPQAAQALTCTLSSAGWALAYDPNALLPTDTTSSVVITCTRTGTDPKGAQNFTLAANFGLQPAGTINQAASGASLLQYNNYSDAAYSLVWGIGSDIIVPINLGNKANSPVTVTVPVYSRIHAGQTTVAAGTFSDSVEIKLDLGGTVLVIAAFPVTATVAPYCTITTPPGNLAFSYTSFQPAAATASTSMTTLCAAGLPYSMSLDLTASSLLGLSYTLNAPAGSYSGTGLPQTYTIDGTIAGGQSGVCTLGVCTGSNIHTLTLTF